MKIHEFITYNRCKPPTDFSHPLWPTSERCFSKGYITKTTKPTLLRWWNNKHTPHEHFSPI